MLNYYTKLQLHVHTVPKFASNSFYAFCKEDGTSATAAAARFAGLAYITSAYLFDRASPLR